MKILISWYAYQNDFDRKDGVKLKEDEPTMQFHEWFYEKGGYDKRVLLSSQREADGDPAIEMLTTSITRKYANRVSEPVLVDVSDPIDLLLIKGKIETILLRYRDHDIDIFFSPGTSAMQVSWYVCYTSLGLRTRLLQTKPPRFSTTKNPELLEIQIETSAVPYSVVIAEQKQKHRSTRPDYLLTDSLKRWDLYYRLGRSRIVADSPARAGRQREKSPAELLSRRSQKRV